MSWTGRGSKTNSTEDGLSKIPPRESTTDCSDTQDLKVDNKASAHQHDEDAEAPADTTTSATAKLDRQCSWKGRRLSCRRGLVAPSIFEEAEECLAQSLLIFLFANLRLLSATGRIITKFETICLDSDKASKTTAAEISGFPAIVHVQPLAATHRESGISPAQLMAILLVEIRREVQNRRTEQGTGGEDAETSLLTTIIDPKGRRQFDEDMHGLLRAYNDMIGEDLNAEIPRVQRSQFVEMMQNIAASSSPLETMKSFIRRDRDGSNRDVNPIKEVGEVGGGEGELQIPATANALPHPAASIPHPQKHRVKRDSKGVGSGRSDNINRVDQRPNDRSASFLEYRGKPLIPLVPNEEAIARQEYKEVGDALFNMSVASSDDQESSNRVLSEDELLDLLERAVESREYGRLDFMTRFFKDGSVSQLMAKSTARIVWMNDWYPMKDCLYAISVDKERKRVLVVFRGAATRADWSHAFNQKLKRVDNPVPGGQPSVLKIHTGFYMYLFRKRKDTGTSKYDEICAKVQEYGSSLIGEDKYSVVVCGHSLGGALSTIFGFWASTNSKLTKNGPLQILSFGSPYVGGLSFADAFRSQERAEKLQHARFHNTRDGVTHLPMNIAVTSRGAKFRHVGVSVLLPRIVTHCFSCRGPRYPSISYEKETGKVAAYLAALKNNYFFNLPLPWRFRLVHSLNEHQRRLFFARTIFIDSGREDDSILSEPLHELYETFVKRK